MYLIQYTVLTVMVKLEIESDQCSVIFLYSTLNSHLRLANKKSHKFSCTPLQYDNNFAMPSSINTLIWTIKFCWPDRKISKIVI
jgi:hypothetical protein